VTEPCELSKINNVSTAVSLVDCPGMGTTKSGDASAEAPDVVSIIFRIFARDL
jgi:hypothetical protein